jgi:Flp pilus assembly protein TadG
LIVFAIIEFGWGFAQYLDVRHGAREAARLAAVDYSTDETVTGLDQTEEIVAEACSRMGGDSSDASVELTLATVGEDDIGDRAFVEVTSTLDTLTGFLDFALAGREINDKISFRLERDIEWAPAAGPLPC